MHTGTLKKMALALTLWLAVHVPSLRAQIFTNVLPLQADTTGTNPVDFEFRADGTLIAKGNYGVGSLLSTDQGVGTRMLWYPALGAFRAGRIAAFLDSTNNQWDLSNIGSNSVAFGENTTASGAYSTASGIYTKASGLYSVAMGYYTIASGYYSTAFGGGAVASGIGSSAFGVSTKATEEAASAFGFATKAMGHYSTAFGEGTTASGSYSTASGSYSMASGTYSTASGFYTSASAYDSFAIGMFNVGGGNQTAWIATDPLFEIGNGNYGTASNNYTPTLSDAFVVYKNGSAAFQGPVIVAPSSDIPMYQPNN